MNLQSDFILLILSLAVGCVMCADMLDEARLQNDLLQNYTRRIRPVRNPMDVINVTINLYLISLKLEEREQRMTSLIWLEQRWNDELLQWNTTEYGGIDRIILDQKQIWIPDLMLRNHIGNNMGFVGDEFYVVKINSTGQVLFWPSKEIQSSCDVDASNYPFDVQFCTINIGKWFSGDHVVGIETDLRYVNTMYYKENEEWELIGKNISRITIVENNENFSQIIYTINIKRRSLFYICNIILPLFFLSLLNNICFILPIESGEKIGMCMSIFLTFAIFLTLINESLPRSSIHIPVYGVYLLFQIFFSAATIALEVLVIYLYHIQTKSRSCIGRVIEHFASRLRMETFQTEISTFQKHQYRLRGLKCENMQENCNKAANIEDSDDVSNCERRQVNNEISKQFAMKLDKLFGSFMFVLNIAASTLFLCYVHANM